MKKKQKIPLKKYLAGAAGFLLGGLLGYSLCAYILGDGTVNVHPFLLLLLFAAAVYVQIILHEGGHLVFGLLSGYQFASFRIGSLMLMKDSQGFHWKRFTLAGTGGQCLLIPPEPVEGMIPVLSYNLGGPLMNLITGGLFLLLWAFLPMTGIWKVSCLLLGVIGVVFGLMNGIPIHTSTIDNDGMNAFSLRKDPKANRALRIQLLINGKTTQGLRLKDMEESWFEIPEAEDMKNPLISALAVFAENRLMDQMRIPEAMELAERLLSPPIGLVGIYRYHLTCDLIFGKLLRGEDPKTVDDLLSKELQSYMKQMKKFPAILRTQYVLALKKDGDPGKAEKIRRTFEKVARSYPYAGDIASDRELMDLADRT